MKITNITASEILDSRGNPTISATVFLEQGIQGTALVPAGASTGRHEAVELRDGDQKRYQGLGVLKALDNIVTKIKPILLGLNPEDQNEIDELMIKLDGTEDKSNLGANAILAVSLAVARAAANSLHQPLYEYLSRFNPDFKGQYIMPLPMMNVLNGGRHANWVTDIQEHLILPIGAPNFSEAVRMGAEIYHHLKEVLKEKGYSISVGDEGGFAPAVKNNEENFDLLTSAVQQAGYKLGSDVIFGIDAAANEFFTDGVYNLRRENKNYSSQELLSFYANLQKKYPIYSWEDVFAEDDWTGFQEFTAANSSVQVIGDDLYVTNLQRLERGIREKSTNSILIKLNQIGTLTETIAVVLLAKKQGLTTVVSHRSGETTDAFIADFAVALETGQIKTGSLARSERLVKYNRLMAISAELKDRATYFNWPFTI